MICFDCGEEIAQTDDDPCIFVGLDRPYVNLPFHKDKCYNVKVRPQEHEYLQEHGEQIWEWYEGGAKKTDGLKPLKIKSRKTKRK